MRLHLRHCQYVILSKQGVDHREVSLVKFREDHFLYTFRTLYLYEADIITPKSILKYRIQIYDI